MAKCIEALQLSKDNNVSNPLLKEILYETFFVPDWGVVFIANEPTSKHEPTLDQHQDSKTDSFQHIMLDTKSVSLFMEYFVAAIRSMFGLTPCLYQSHSAETSCLPTNSSRILSSPYNAIAEWELNALFVSHTQYYTFETSQLLLSLSSLLHKVPFMPVPDEIGIAVSNAINALQNSHNSKMMGNWKDAAMHAREGSIHANHAFFDSSMMPMLYFPEDHLIAVYIPFFFPILLPFLVTLKNHIRRRKKMASAKIKQS
jgi:phosphatidylinositol glycan class S